MDPMKVEVKEIENLFKLDSYIKPFEREIRRRSVKYFGDVKNLQKHCCTASLGYRNTYGRLKTKRK